MKKEYKKIKSKERLLSKNRPTLIHMLINLNSRHYGLEIIRTELAEETKKNLLKVARGNWSTYGDIIYYLENKYPTIMYDSPIIYRLYYGEKYDSTISLKENLPF